MKILITISLGVIFFILGMPTVSLAIERGCKGILYIKKGDLKLTLDSFSARGYHVWPNTARAKARAKLQKCAGMARDLRWEHRKPDHCERRADVYDYDINSLKIMIEKVACKAGQDKGTFEVRVKGIGDKNCSFDHQYMSYDMVPQMCKVMAGWEWNRDRSGADYKNFELIGANPGLCEKQCQGERKCKAWTYVKPGIQGRQAKCWLKTQVPQAHENPGMVSGVKK